MSEEGRGSVRAAESWWRAAESRRAQLIVGREGGRLSHREGTVGASPARAAGGTAERHGGYGVKRGTKLEVGMGY